jgi:hypothetical protein
MGPAGADLAEPECPPPALTHGSTFALEGTHFGGTADRYVPPAIGKNNMTSLSS